MLLFVVLLLTHSDVFIIVLVRLLLIEQLQDDCCLKTSCNLNHHPSNSPLHHQRLRCRNNGGVVVRFMTFFYVCMKLFKAI